MCIRDRGAAVARRWGLWWTGIATCAIVALLATISPSGAQEATGAFVNNKPTNTTETGDAEVLLVVSNVKDGVVGASEDDGLLAMMFGQNRAEQWVLAELEQFATVRVVADHALRAEDLVGADSVVITAATSSAEFKPFLFKASVPIVAMKPANWNALGLSTRNVDSSTPLQDVSTIQPDYGHPIAALLNPDVVGDGVDLFTGDSHTVGRGWVTGFEPVGTNVGTVVASGPVGAALIAFEPGDELGWPFIDASDTAVACRVAFPSNGSRNALLSGCLLYTSPSPRDS